MTTIIWFRNDLRVHDHPALLAACAAESTVIPVFILDSKLISGPTSSPNRNKFLKDCLSDLAKSLEQLGSRLILRNGDPVDELAKLSAETGAQAIFYTPDYTPFSTKRDRAVAEHLSSLNIQLVPVPGKLMVTDLDAIRTQSGGIFKIFTPFWRAWQKIPRRAVCSVPTKLQATKARLYSVPIDQLIPNNSQVSPLLTEGGETIARRKLQTFLQTNSADYQKNHDDLAANKTSGLSPYLHFGCISVIEIESMLTPNEGNDAWHRQLAWRDFYHYILHYFPHTIDTEFQERYQKFSWGSDSTMLNAWQTGNTGYPIVDAGMRQLIQEGWMHNRARLIVGSFLTKDLGLDWRLGARHFMNMLVDGDTANNIGNWQWIASVGVDPAPVFRRLYNPSSQQAKFDQTNDYVKKYIPQLKDVPDQYLAEPWKMPQEVQTASNCIIGVDYPAPTVDHAAARIAALERYRSH